ncbi:MAG: FG-GAP-like repeat-containing protein [Myxococcota bacterium]|nr:FG-GAP-like repeat-containing protein [Myxococcota bacterium]
MNNSLEEEGAPTGRWLFSGFVSDTEPGQALRLVLDPPIPDAPATVTVDEELRFSFELSSLYSCPVQLTLETEDSCGGLHQSPTYTLCMDAARPTVSVTVPGDGALIRLRDDLDPEQDGIQVNAEVELSDVRADEPDYTVEIECAEGELGPWSVVSTRALRRSEIAAGETLTISFTEAGQRVCRARLGESGLNTPVLPLVNVRVITTTPLFRVSAPFQAGEESICVSGALFVGGAGENFEGDAALRYELLGEGELIIDTAQLEAQGDAQSGAPQFGASLDSSRFRDGSYLLRFRGIAGGEDVTISPDTPFTLRFDNTAPSLGLLFPESLVLGAEDDSDDFLGNCIQSELELSLEDQNTEEVCYQLNGGPVRCGNVEGGSWRSQTVTFGPGSNQLVLSAIDCAGNQREVSIDIETQGCEETLWINAPGDGSVFSALDDEDPAVEGWQIELTIQGDRPAGGSLTVELRDGDETSSFGPIDWNGESATLPITLPAPIAMRRTVELVPLLDDQPGLSASYTLLAPEETPSLTIVPPEGGCLALAQEDASPLPGYQWRFTARGDRLSDAAAYQIEANCAGAEEVSTATGRLIDSAEGVEVLFDPVTLIELGDCTLTASGRSIDGARLRTTLEVDVDQIAPLVTLTRPADGSVLTVVNDIDEAPGIQLRGEVEVCGAAGQSFTLSTDPPQAEPSDPFPVPEGEEECAVLSVGILSFPSGLTRLAGDVRDSCGNEGRLNATIEANTGSSLQVAEPADQSTIIVSDDLDPERAGCQVNLLGLGTGFAGGQAQLHVCSDLPPADGDLESAQVEVCNGGFDLSAESCAYFGENSQQIDCTLSFSNGVHEFALVGVLNDQVTRSNISRVLVDCEAPEITSIELAEDLDENSCINRQERLNLGSEAGEAVFTVNFESTGIEDGQSLSLRKVNLARVLGVAEVQGNRGTINNVQLSPGVHQLYLVGGDAAGNPLPRIDGGEPRFLSFTIDTSAPSPTLDRLVEGQCLGVIADEAPDAPALQRSIVVNGGGEAGEVLDLSLFIDDGVPVIIQDSVRLQERFPAQNLTEGAHEVSVVVQDACGNSGSVAGFELRVDGEEDWSRPRTVPFTVDITPPVLQLEGIESGALLSAEDDQDGDASNGFQLDFAVRSEGIPAGSALRLFSGESLLVGEPNPLLSAVLGASAPVRVTLPPGPHSIQSRANDSCGNEGRSPAIPIEIEVDGCVSQITSLVEGQVLSAADGASAGGLLNLSVAGTVSLLDPRCADAAISLLRDGGVIAAGAVNEVNGDVIFEGVQLPEGQHQLSLRVVLEGEQLDSLGLNVSVDLSAPQVRFDSPQGAEPVNVLNDEEPGVEGQQITIRATISETAVVTDRLASLEINGVQFGELLAVEALEDVQISFPLAPLPEGESTLRICVVDGVGNQGCATLLVNADSSEPEVINGLEVVSVDPRNGEARLRFTTPADDIGGASPPVAYLARWNRSTIDDELSWAAATPLDAAGLTPPATGSVVGDVQELQLEGLAPNETIFVALRAVDEVEREGPITSLSNNLELNRHTSNIIKANGSLWSSDLSGLIDAPLHQLGDVSGDGTPDLLVNAFEFGGVGDGAVMLILGNEVPSNSAQLPLTGDPRITYFGISASPLGDVNGDGASDFGVLGVNAAFDESFVLVYFGCSAACPVEELAAPDSIIRLTGVYLTLRGAGNVNHRAADPVDFDDIVLGGNGSMLSVIAGRQNWPALDQPIFASAADQANGVTLVSPVNTGDADLGSVGFRIGHVGDLDLDGRDEIVFQAGAGTNRAFMLSGGEDLPEEIYLDTPGVDLNELTPHCDPAIFGSDGRITNFGSFVAGGVDLDNTPGADFFVGSALNKVIMGFDQNGNGLDCVQRSDGSFGRFFSVAGDINGDGEHDLIVLNQDSNSTLAYLFFNDGAGRFGGEDLTPRGISMRIATPAIQKVGVSGAGDLNGDGQDDFAVLVKGDGSDPLQLVLYY